jgi:hypothetical protein
VRTFCPEERWEEYTVGWNEAVVDWSKGSCLCEVGDPPA